MAKAPRRADLSSAESRKAMKAANAEIERQFGVSAIDPTSPDAAKMRQAWMDAYVKNGGALKQVKGADVQKAAEVIDQKATLGDVDEIVLPCGKKVHRPPKNKTHPCDVSSLRVGVWSKKSIVADLTAAENLTRQPVPDDAPDRIDADLVNSDLVIEAISTCFLKPEDGDIPEDVTQEVIEVTVETQWLGPCPESKHPLVIVNPRAETVPAIDQISRSAKVLQFEVRPPMPGFWERTFGWLSFPKPDPLLVDISATSCGVRFDDPPKFELTALMRVYPKDDWKISLKLPAVGEFKGSGSGKKAGEVDTFKGEGRIGPGRFEIEKGGEEEEEEDSGSKEEPRNEWLVVTRNGTEVNALNILRDIVHCIQTAKTALHRFKGWLKVKPQAGWLIGIDIKFLEGSISYSRGYRASNDLRGDRFVAIEPYAELSASMKLIEASIELGFGFQLQIPNIVDWFKSKYIAEAVLKIAGKVECKAEIEGKMSIGGEDEKEVAIKYVPGGRRIYLQATAAAVGLKLEAVVGVKSDYFSFKGKAVFSHAKPFTANMTVAFAKGVAWGYVFVDIGIYDCSPYFNVDLWPDIPLYDGPFPPSAEGVPEWIQGVTGHG